MFNSSSSLSQGSSTLILARRYHDEFGPAASGRFDFTILFEDVFLSIIPAALLLLMAPMRMYTLYKQPLKVRSTSVHENKMLFFAGYTVLQFALLILWSLTPDLGSKATFAAALLSFLAAITLTVLSHLEHLRSVRPSVLINVYLLFTLLFDAAKVRTLWQIDGTKNLAAVYSSSMSVKLLLLVTEGLEKRGILFERFRHPSPEATSGIYSLSTFYWLNSLMRLGFGKHLSLTDLYPVDDDMSTTTLLSRSSTAWANATKDKSHAFLYAMLWSLRWTMLYAMLPRLFPIGFKYAQPFLIARTITFAQSLSQPDYIGWSLAGALGLVLIGLAISNAIYKYMAIRFTTSVRGSLVTLIYRNTMTLGTSFESTKALTLMSTDIEAICDAAISLFEAPGALIECGIAFWLVYNEVGFAFVSPAVVAVVVLGCITVVSKFMGNTQKTWIESIETRVSATTDWLTNAKVVKMLGFTDVLENLLQKLRQDEVNSSRKYRRIFQIRILLSFLPQLIAPLLTFTIFIASAKKTGLEISAARIFSIVSILTILSNPLSTVVEVLPTFATAIKCFGRIQDFLNAEAKQDHRLVLDSANRTSEAQPSAGQNLQSNDFIPHSDLLTARDASIGWSKTEPALLNNLNFSIRQGSFNFIIGPVNSGKSTLLKALLGEAVLKQGFIYTRSPHAAFVDQTPWIKNASLRDNVLGISSWNAPWYAAVIRACALDVDITNMKAGDKTLVGSGGITLSGGQKQRLALARAVYSREKLVIIDDAFSGLDAETEEKVFTRLMGQNGLLRKSATTVLLVTHAVHRLSFSDNIISLGASGHIVEQGTYSTLQLNDGYVSSLNAGHHARRPSEEIIEDAEAAEAKLQLDFNAIEETEVPELRKNGDLQTYLYYFNLLGNWRMIVYLFVMIFAGAGINMDNLVITFWSNAVGTGEGDNSHVNNFYLGLFGAVVAGAYVFVLVTAWWYLVIMVPDGSELAHAQLLKTVMNAPLSFFTSNDVGTIVNRFSQDLTVFDIELPYKFIDFSFGVMMVVTGAVLMCISASYFAATMPAVIGIIWILQKYYLRTSRQIRLLDLEAKSPLYSHFIESLSGLMTLRAFGWSEAFEDRNIELLDASQKPFYLLFCIQQWLNLILDLLVASLGVILMVLITVLRKDLSGGFVGLALVNVMTFNQNLAYLIRNWTGLETSLGAVSRIRNFCAETKSENLTAEANEVPANFPAYGKIELKDLKAAYKPGDKLVLTDVNITIEPGQRIGLCGRSGSGKSSILATIFRMLELAGEDSSISIDGFDLMTLSRQQIRRSINSIPQDPFFLRGSVRFNADPRHEHDDAAILAALGRVQLAETVAAKGGLDATLDPDFFSHGQRQLFCLARAMLRKSSILVLDEATSSVDVKTDLLMQEIIRQEFKHCTILAVAHRLDTILDFDAIAVLDAGKIIEYDTPKNLLARDSAFRRLYDS